MDYAILLNMASGAAAGDTGAALGSSGFMIVILLFFVVYMWMAGIEPRSPELQADSLLSEPQDGFIFKYPKLESLICLY